jgi:hypothetical protein
VSIFLIIHNVFTVENFQRYSKCCCTEGQYFDTFSIEFEDRKNGCILQVLTEKFQMWNKFLMDEYLKTLSSN